MSNLNEEIGSRIKQSILKAKVSQKRLALELDVSEPTINAYIQGRVGVSASAFQVISKLCGVSIDWLITGKEPEKSPEPITYQLNPRDHKFLNTLQEQLELYGLEKRFHVTEIHQPPPGQPQQQITDDEKRLLRAFRNIDDTSKKMHLGLMEQMAGFISSTEIEEKPTTLAADVKLNNVKNAHRT